MNAPITWWIAQLIFILSTAGTEYTTTVFVDFLCKVENLLSVHYWEIKAFLELDNPSDSNIAYNFKIKFPLNFLYLSIKCLMR